MSFCCAICKDYEQQTHLRGKCLKTKTLIVDSTDPKQACSLGKPVNFNDGGANVTTVEIQSIVKSTFVMREIDESVVSDLVLNIKEHGLLQPIMVRETKKGYEIVFGRHRLEACKRLGYKQISAIIRNIGEDDAVFLQITENIQRNSKDGLLRQGMFYSRLHKHGWSTYDIGKKIGKSAVYVGDCIAVAEKLHPDLKLLLSQRKIVPSMAHRIAELPKERQIEIAEKVLTENWRVKDFELQVRQRKVIECHCLTCPKHGMLLREKCQRHPPEDEMYFAGTWIRRRSNKECEECVFCGHLFEIGEYCFPLKHNGALLSFVSCESCALSRVPEEFIKLFNYYRARGNLKEQVFRLLDEQANLTPLEICEQLNIDKAQSGTITQYKMKWRALQSVNMQSTEAIIQ
jgi:ParB family chromosome partitioning protein